MGIVMRILLTAALAFIVTIEPAHDIAYSYSRDGRIFQAIARVILGVSISTMITMSLLLVWS